MTGVKFGDPLCRYGEKTKLLKNGSREESPASIETSLSKLRHRILLDMYAYDVIFSKESYTVLSFKSDGQTSNTDNSFDEDTVSISHFQLADETHVYKRSFLFAKCCKILKNLSVWKLLRWGVSFAVVAIL